MQIMDSNTQRRGTSLADELDGIFPQASIQPSPEASNDKINSLFSRDDPCQSNNSKQNVKVLLRRDSRNSLNEDVRHPNSFSSEIEAIFSTTLTDSFVVMKTPATSPPDDIAENLHSIWEGQNDCKHGKLYENDQIWFDETELERIVIAGLGVCEDDVGSCSLGEAEIGLESHNTVFVACKRLLHRNELLHVIVLSGKSEDNEKLGISLETDYYGVSAVISQLPNHVQTNLGLSNSLYHLE